MSDELDADRAALRAWIDAHDELTCDIEAIKAIDLERFLQQTAGITLAPAERLRQLAIRVEAVACAAPQPRGWSGLRRIYDLALKSAEGSDEGSAVRDAVLRSLALSAQRCADTIGEDARDEVAERARRIREEGYAAADQLARSTDAVGQARELLGALTYFDPAGDVEVALEHFGAAIDHGHLAGWAPFYRACALHDLARWPEALAAYDAIPAEWFADPERAWRYEVYLDQRAWCALQAGQRERAVKEFLALIARYLDDPELREDAWAEYLREAAAGPLKAELAAAAEPLWALLDEL